MSREPKNKFEITSIRCHKYKESQENGVVGVASIVINGVFLINDIRIINANDKMFCGMPSKRKDDKEFVDICHPLNLETRKYLENLVLAEFINTPIETEEVKKDE